MNIHARPDIMDKKTLTRSPFPKRPPSGPPPIKIRKEIISMIRFERTSVMNLENAIRGARNPMNSWARMDSYYDEDGNFVWTNDLDLAKRLRKAGSDHRKYIRQVFVSVDITAPIYWWKEYDTYKIATVANSTSTMHKIHSKPFSMDDFSHDHMTPETLAFMETVVERLEAIRLKYVNEGKNKEDWYDLIQLLPESSTRCVPAR